MLIEHGNTVVLTQMENCQPVSVAVEVACLSGRCCYPRFGLAVLCASGGAFSPKSETHRLNLLAGKE